MTFNQALIILRNGGSPLASWNLTPKQVAYFKGCLDGSLAYHTARRT